MYSFAEWNIWHDVTRKSMSKDITTDRVFQFHGQQCGSCDKADDTTKTNTADLWKLYGAIQFP